MNLKDFLAISGQSGLFRYIAQGRNGLVVESLLTGKKMFVTSAQKVSILEDIAIYTNNNEVALKEVFKNIYNKENGGPAISHKSNENELRKYMEEILPDYDRERVYVSDIRKILQWYNILQERNLLNFEEVEKDNTENKSEETKSETAESEKLMEQKSEKD